MELICSFLVIYIIMFLVDYFILKNLKKYRINEFEYMKKRFKLKNKKGNYIKVITSFLNAFIMTIVCIFVLYINWPLIITLPISFILLLLLVYSLYGLYGNLLGRKYEKKIKKSK